MSCKEAVTAHLFTISLNSISPSVVGPHHTRVPSDTDALLEACVSRALRFLQCPRTYNWLAASVALSMVLHRSEASHGGPSRLHSDKVYIWEAANISITGTVTGQLAGWPHVPGGQL